MDFTYPEKYLKVSEYFKSYIGDLECTTVLSDQEKLIFYALQKQAEEGACKGVAPSFWDIRAFYKYKAWSSLGNMSKFEAMVYFVKQFEKILGGPVNWRQKIAETQAGPADGTLAKSVSHSVVETSSEMHLVDPLEWDNDLSEHAEATAANIAFLASEAMRARRLCGKLQQLNQSLVECVESQKMANHTLIPYPPPHYLSRSSSQMFPKPRFNAHEKALLSLASDLPNCPIQHTLSGQSESTECGMMWLNWI